LYMPNWSGSLSPQVWTCAGGFPVKFAGVENMTLDVSATSSVAVRMHTAYGCWAKNITVIGNSNYQVSFMEHMIDVRCEVRHCWLKGVGRAGLDQYGFYMRCASGMLHEDNIAEGIGVPFMMQGFSGSVVAYNYTTNCVYPGAVGGYEGYSTMYHGGHPN